jgi:hypothetical protein
LELSQALINIHLSFDSWTTKGGKHGFLGVVAHFVSKGSKLRDLPIALLLLADAHSGKRMAEVVSQTMQQFGINPLNVGFFVLDNASNNDAAICKLA